MDQTDRTYIHYHFLFEGKDEIEFRIDLRLNDLLNLSTNSRKYPDWAKLEYEKCRNCPLNSYQHTYCPIAANLVDIIEKFSEFKSFEKVLTRVETPHRTYEKVAQLQVGLGSIIGIIMVTSGCPVMSVLRPMVRFHLPFATIEETMFRSASCYLLGQYFQNKKQNKPDWSLEGLAEAYEQIQIVNHGMTDRLRSITKEDANINAIVVLDVFAKALPSSIFVELSELEYLFKDIYEPV